MRHPVIRLEFSRSCFENREGLHASLKAQLERLEEPAGQRVIVLIDEYDKPILDALDNRDVARANRDHLHGLYSTLKFNDADIRLSFLTGVSKFSKVSLFPGLNKLYGLTLEPRFSALCGYTEADLDEVFAPELPGLNRERIREWYNGYSWLGEEKVYNPFDSLAAVRTSPVRPLVVRNRDAVISCQDADAAWHRFNISGGHARYPGPAVGVRRGRD